MKVREVLIYIEADDEMIKMKILGNRFGFQDHTVI